MFVAKQSLQRTFFAPRSTSISTSRAPTKPVPPVMAQIFGTGGCSPLRDVAFCSGERCGERRDAIARALVKYDPEMRSALKRGGFLTRDPREKERKKYGLAGARKRFQFSKR